MLNKRKIEIYKIDILRKTLQRNEDTYYKTELKDKIILENFLDFYYNNSKEIPNDIKHKNLLYYNKDIKFSKQSRLIKMEYVKYNKNVTVVDKETLTAKYIKEKNQGDLEKQHYVLKILEDKAIIAFEKIQGAVTKSLLENNLNKYFKEWTKTYECDYNLKEYCIKISSLPSPDFINELTKFEKISLVKITVDKNSLTTDEDIQFSGDNESKESLDLIYKPKGSFSRSSVKSYWKKFNNQKKGQEKIKRIVISGRISGQTINLDTNLIKLNKYISTKSDLNGLVDTNSIFDQCMTILDSINYDLIENISIEDNKEE